MAALIGITTSELRDPREHVNREESDPPMRELALGLAYPRSIVAAGGVPVVIPPFSSDEEIAELLDRLDGVCLAGGPDIHPSHYGQQPDPNLGPTESDLDRAELRLIRVALDRGLPMLCICRGAQALNVARGGTLVQDLPGHRQDEPGRLAAHAIDVEPGSRLARALRCTELEVNSFHHQAVDRLGSGLRVVARDPEGLIEGIEAVDREWVVGVQWHAEGMVDAPEQAALFQAFLAAAEDFGASRDRAAAA